VRHYSPLFRKIDVGGLHSLNFRQCALHCERAAASGHSLDFQGGDGQRGISF
jgi:hypothetical protein